MEFNTNKLNILIVNYLTNLKHNSPFIINVFLQFTILKQNVKLICKKVNLHFERKCLSVSLLKHIKLKS